MASSGWEISGRVALVTGGGRGIGLETARLLVARGARVGLVDIDGERAAQEARALGDRAAIGLEADVCDRAAVEAAVETISERFGGVDVLVANAGIHPPTTTLRRIDPEAFERTVEVNLLGVWRTVRAGLPQIVERRGYVLVVASLYAAMNGFVASPYAASKAGVEQLGRALRVELAAHGASAGVAYFGFIDTDMVRDAFDSPVAERLRRVFPEWLSRPVPVARAATAMVDGIERRAPRVTAPRWVPWILAARGLLRPLDARLERDPEVAAAIAEAESLAAPGASRASSAT